MKKTVIMVVNPISGDVDKVAYTEAAQAFAEKENLEFILYETIGNGDIPKIKALYEQHKPERILVAGGDGTIKEVAEALEHYDVIIGILPAGSANGLSVDLNLPDALEENLKIAFHNNYMEMDMICINGKKSLHLSDLGLNAQLVKNYENSSTRGMIGYALQAITTLSEQEEPFTATIVANNKTTECVARMIVIANSQKYGTGVTINPTGVMNDGKFEIVILKNLDLLVFGKIITGNMPADTDDVEIISTDKAKISLENAVSFQIDGEYIGQEKELDIYILPGQMKVAIP
ncbi:diacylglycerol/lipid kinase family protein [Flavobacterium noncentrifugens]|uniref:Lipid kinase, YegS/Rv2252/BmrU family n=1 Tax=Flavobacterium noncentrifugens TaxID=1128970 RepID=A0A1G8RHB6_9FLAO|nr:diacylglycerol kinase family protein [Flavobacterium noncentrifugens]SDJ16387.1 lipid kinase, YegS/Rv2252/BmrU family [Flavobacterium noncentrifugens]